MTKSTLGDLNLHLFAQLERLNDEDLSAEDLKKEIERSKAVTSVANSIIANGNLVLKARVDHENQMRGSSDPLPRMLEG